MFNTTRSLETQPCSTAVLLNQILAEKKIWLAYHLKYEKILTFPYESQNQLERVIDELGGILIENNDMLEFFALIGLLCDLCCKWRPFIEKCTVNLLHHKCVTNISLLEDGLKKMLKT